MRFLTFLFSFFLLSLGHAKNVNVRLFSTATLSQCWITTHGAPYFLIALDAKGNLLDTVSDLSKISASRSLHIITSGSKVLVKQGTESFGTFHRLMLVPKSAQSHFIIKGSGRERIYSGTLLFRVYPSELQIINRVDLEEYVAGVVESEGGHYAQYEYFKAQAVLARTWVLKNWDKHSKEGYNVRDDVSSQAYYSKAYLQYSDNILQAVLDTKDTILVDANGEAIFGAFHANSGGETVNSEDCWSGKMDYLRGVNDSFSLKMEKAYWTKEVDKAAFINYFASKLGQSASNEDFRKAVLNFQQNTRKNYFTYNGKSLKLTLVRSQFKLRSTFFSVSDEGANVKLSGRGFGHGVGMSQEGAMYMAEVGFCYQDILQHYFKDTRFGVVK